MTYTKENIEIGDRFRYKDPKETYPEHTIISISDTHIETAKSDRSITSRYDTKDIVNHINKKDIIFIKNIKNYEIY